MRPKKPPWQLGWRWVYYLPGRGKGGGGSAGVREPRRPRPRGGSGTASLRPRSG